MKDPVSALLPAADQRHTVRSLPVLPPAMALIEIAVLFFGISLLDLMYPAFEIGDLRPHPYWVPVLLLSLQYGTVSGLTAAAVAVGLRAYAGFPEQGGSETYFTYLLKIWIEPILWIAAAVVLGQFRMRQISRQQDLIHQVSELANQRAALADYGRNLRSHCTALERQIAGRNEPGAILLLQAIDEARAGLALDEALRRIVSLALPGAKASLYLADGAGLKLAASTGYDSVDPPANITAVEPLYRAIAIEGRGVSVLSADGEAALAGTGLVASPIFAGTMVPSSSARPVAGMIRIEQMDPALLGAASVAALSAIGLAFAPALEARLSAAGQKPLPAPEASVAATTYKMLRRLRWFSPAVQPGAVPPDGNVVPHPSTKAVI